MKSLLYLDERQRLMNESKLIVATNEDSVQVGKELQIQGRLIDTTVDHVPLKANREELIDLFRVLENYMI
jgi:hypothetical protein